MQLNVAKEVVALDRLSVKDLRDRYSEVFGDETRTGNKAWLIKRIAWRIQALAEGDLSARARQRAEELANDADLRMSPPKPKPVILPSTASSGGNRVPIPGSIITRDYKGQTLLVQVRKDGFEYDGQVFRSLSAVAKTITGSHCNGYLFFGLRTGAQK